MCNQGHNLLLKIADRLVPHRMKICDLFEFSLSMSLFRLWHSKASCDWQYRRLFAFFSLLSWSKSHKRSRRWGFNFTQQYRISLSQFLFPESCTIEIIQSALTDPKVINLSNEHFPPLLLCLFQSHSLSLNFLIYFLFFVILEMSEWWLIKYFHSLVVTSSIEISNYFSSIFIKCEELKMMMIIGMTQGMCECEWEKERKKARK